MYSLSKEKIKQIVFIPLFIFSSGVLSQTLNFSDVLTLIDENNHVTIPSNYTEIGNSAFKYTAVVTVTIPASVTTIGARAFEHTSKLSEIVNS